MLKTLRAMCVALSVIGLLATSAVAANPPVNDLDGRQWLISTPEEQLAFLYGVASVIGVEQAIATQNKSKPSIFVEKWMQTFGNSTLSDVRAKVGEWYKGHPDGQNRHVFDVLWYEFMAPGTR